MLLQATLNENNLKIRLKIIYSKFLKTGQLLAIDTLFNEKKRCDFCSQDKLWKKYGISFYLGVKI